MYDLPREDVGLIMTKSRLCCLKVTIYRITNNMPPDFSWHLDKLFIIAEVFTTLLGTCIAQRRNDWKLCAAGFKQPKVVNVKYHAKVDCTITSFIVSIFCRIFLQDPFPTNPDLLLLVLFIHTQLTTTVTLAFLFGSKVSILCYMCHGTNFKTSLSNNDDDS